MTMLNVLNHSSDYDFPGPVEPMDNQLHRFDFLLAHQYAFDLSDMGTGKTYTALWALDYLLYQAGGAAMVIAPLSTLETIWETSCRALFKDRLRAYSVLYGPIKKRTKAIVERVADIYITNPTALLNLDFRKAIVKSDIHTFVLDEVTAFKDERARRSRYLQQVAYDCNVWGLTATPMPNSALNAYGIAKAVRQNYAETYTAFRRRTHIRNGMYDWAQKENAKDAAAKLLQPSIRVKRADCYAIPDCLTVQRKVEISTEAKFAIAEIDKEMSLILSDGSTITPAHEAVVRGKILQLVGGSVYVDNTTGSTEKIVSDVGMGTRGEVLREVLEQTEEKVVVFTHYRHHTDLIVDILDKAKESYVVVNGSTSLKDRTEYIRLFQDTRLPRVIVADPRTMAHGIELTRGSIIIWWVPVDSNELYRQAIGRFVRRGQVNRVTNIQLCGSPLEAIIYRKLENNEKIQGSLLADLAEAYHNGRRAFTTLG